MDAHVDRCVCVSVGRGWVGLYVDRGRGGWVWLPSTPRLFSCETPLALPPTAPRS